MSSDGKRTLTDRETGNGSIHSTARFSSRRPRGRCRRADETIEQRLRGGGNCRDRSPRDRAGYYPPLLNGMRGSHPGSFEAAHALRDGVHENAGTETGEVYDLIVVGAGISGLAAAHFFRAQTSRGKPHPHSRQSRRLRRPRQAKRVFLGRTDAAVERRELWPSKARARMARWQAN